jgi:hypothetical protein
MPGRQNALQLKPGSLLPATSALPVGNQVYYRWVAPSELLETTYAQWRLDLD